MSPRAVALSLALVGTLDGPANDNGCGLAAGTPGLPMQELHPRGGEQHPGVHAVLAGEPGGREDLHVPAALQPLQVPDGYLEPLSGLRLGPAPKLSEMRQIVADPQGNALGDLAGHEAIVERDAEMWQERVPAEHDMSMSGRDA